jgi:hypothetical protein
MNKLLVKAYLEDNLYGQLIGFCTTNKLKVSKVVQDSITLFLNGEIVGYDDYIFPAEKKYNEWIEFDPFTGEPINH